MRTSFFIFSFCFSQIVFCQSSIPYQAVVRNSYGAILANTALTMVVMIHHGSADGAVIYQESHTLSSDDYGLVKINIGDGGSSTGSLDAINWGDGAKFLHVSIDAGAGTVDLGTQQMMSVPYALHAHETYLRVSATGDSLIIGNTVTIVPGISAANNLPVVQTGETLLPGNTICVNEPISVTSCDGTTSLVYQNTTYDLIEIGGQCWFGDNLAATMLNDGTPIPNVTDNTAWNTTTTPAYCYYQSNTSYQALYGNLYNFATVQTDQLCPTGWHVPSDCEWMYMEGSLGLSIADQQYGAGFRGTTEGDALKSLDGWNIPHTAHNNSTGFTAFPGGYRFTTGSFSGRTLYGYWATSTADGNTGNVWNRKLNVGNSNISRTANSGIQGYSVRCIKD